MDADELLRESDRLRDLQTAAEQDKNRPGRLLAGEDPLSTDPEDAAQWAAVYQELVTFKRHLLNESRAAHERVREEGAAELRHDLEVLDLQYRRLRLHLAFWRERLGEGESAPREFP